MDKFQIELTILKLRFSIVYALSNLYPPRYTDNKSQITPGLFLRVWDNDLTTVLREDAWFAAISSATISQAVVFISNGLFRNFLLSLKIMII